MSINKILAESIGNESMIESSLSRVKEHFNQFECAVITASRERIQNVTDRTFIPKDGSGSNVFELTNEMNRHRNSDLKSTLLKLGYGVTAQDGRYREKGSTKNKPGRETSYLVVNLENDPDFKDNIFDLAEYYNQDSFLHKAKGSNEAELIGTNNASDPGYDKSKSIGEFYPNAIEGALSKIGNRAYQFRKYINSSAIDCAENVICEDTFKRQQLFSKRLADDGYERVKRCLRSRSETG